MTRLTDDALAELARLAGEATPGPWWYGWPGDPETDGMDAAGPLNVGAIGRGKVAEFAPNPYGAASTWPDAIANARFVARADPSTVAALVAEVQRLRAATDELWRLALRAHVECDDCWYSCPKSEGGTCNEEWHDGECRCGADAHNARVASIRAALDGAE